MTIMVTGGAGYIGSHMVHALRERAAEVVVLDDLSTGFDWALAPGVPLVVGDIGDQALVANTIRDYRVEAIIHFAGSVVVSDSMRDPLAYYRNNTGNSRALLASAVNGGVRYFIFSSSAAVYGNPVAVPVREDAQRLPISPYGWSKLMTETMLADVGRAHGLKYAILRYFNVAGADPSGRTGQSTNGATHLIKVAVETALGLRPKLALFGTDYPTPDGTCVRDYIHVSDLVAAHCDALGHLRGGADSLTLNCGYGHGFSVREVIAAVEAVAGRALAVENAPRRPGDPALLVADAGRLREVLRWQPRYDDLATIVAHALAWERALARRRATQR